MKSSMKSKMHEISRKCIKIFIKPEKCFYLKKCIEPLNISALLLFNSDIFTTSFLSLSFAYKFVFLAKKYMLILLQNNRKKDSEKTYHNCPYCKNIYLQNLKLNKVSNIATVYFIRDIFFLAV